ncbi:MAG: hypothetical protein AB1465_05095 [Patescibacteria group bacterium]
MLNTSKTNSQTRLIKQIILGGVTLLFFILFWLFLSRIFNPSGASNLTIDFFSLVFYFVFLSFLGVLVGVDDILVERAWILLLTYFISCGLFFIFFPFKILYFFGILFLFLALIWGYFRIKGEKQDRIKFSAQKIAKYSLPLFLTFTILISAFAYYYAVSEIIKEKGFQIPREVFDKAAIPLEKIISSFIPGFNKTATIEEVFYLFTINEMKKADQGGDFDTMPLPSELSALLERKGLDLRDKEAVFEAIQADPEIRKETIKFISQAQQGGQPQEEDEISKMLKDFNVSKDEPIFDALYKVANEQVNKAVGPFLKYFPIAFALVFFFSVRFVFLFLIWVLYFFIWVLIKVLLALKFVKLEKEKREVEILRL